MIVLLAMEVTGLITGMITGGNNSDEMITGGWIKE